MKECKLIDLEKELEKKESYFYNHIHYTDEGSQRLAEIIFDRIKNLIEKS